MIAGWVCRFLCFGAIAVACGRAASFSNCDVNSDGVTNVADVQKEINEALGVTSATNDLNGDGAVNVADVQIVINAALGLGCSADTATISDFSPKSGPIGTSVTLTASSFAAAAQVSMPKQGGGTIGQPVSSLSSTSLTFTIAAGSATGRITVIAGSAILSTASSFTVTPANTFALAASPSSASLIMGQTISYSVQLSSANGFNQLAALTVSGVPSGVTALFVPRSITAGQTSILTLNAPASQSLSANNALTITAAAMVNGLPVSRTANVSLSVVGPTTTLMGRTTAADNLETPLAGVIITSVGQDGNGNTTGCTGQATTSDGAGNFALPNLPVACTGPQLFSFNGGTVTSPAGKYAGVQLVFTIVAGQVTVSPINVHLPRIDTAETFYVQQNAPTDQTYSYATIPGLKVVVYANTTITMSDGTRPNPYPLAGLEIPPDRLPDVKAQVPTMIMAQILAFQPENSTASQPIAVYYPNAINTPPLVDGTLITLDPQRGTMVPYGTGAVSADGTQVIPDPDPAHPGHLYGLVRPGWHFFGCPPNPAPPPPPDLSHLKKLRRVPPTIPPGYPPPLPPPPGGWRTSGPRWGVPDNPPTPPVPPPGPPPLFSSDPPGPPPLGSPNADNVFNNELPSPDDLLRQIYAEMHSNALQAVNGSPSGGDPIYFASGTDIVEHIDLRMSGRPLSIELDRGFYTNSSSVSAFGIGCDHDFDFAIDNPSNTAATFNLIMPFGGRRVPFVRQANGTLMNTVDPAFAGAVFTTAADNSSVMRMKWGDTYSFSPAGFLIGISDPNGDQIVVNRNPESNEVTFITDNLGRQLVFSYPPAGQPVVTSIVDSSGRTLSYTYDTQFHLTSFTDANGRVWQYSWSGGFLSSITDPRGVVVGQNTYDANGRVVNQVQADGSMLQFAYTYYNPILPSTSPILTTTVTDQLGRQTVYRFNSQGYPIQITDPLGQVRNINRAPGSNQILSITGPGMCGICADNPGLGDVSYTYDANGNPLTRSDSLGNTFTYTYDPVFNKITSVTDPTGAVTAYQYDGNGNLTSITDPRGNHSRLTIGAFGLPSSYTDPANRTTSFQYDSFGNPTSIQDPLGDTTAIAYDQLFRPAHLTDPNGAQHFRSWDSLDRLVRATDAKGGATAWAYDAVGNLLTQTDPRGSQNSWTYDNLSRMISRTDGLGRTEKFGYDPLGNLTSHTDRRGQVAQFTYDGVNRLTAEAYPDATVTRSYDANSRLLQVADSQGGTFVYQYDSAGRLLNSVSPTGAVTYTLDGRGHMLSRQASGLPQVTYQYDPAGNLTQAAMAQASVNLTYDVRNQLSSVSRSNGVTSAFTRDALGRVLTISHQAGNNTLASFSYAYDPAGNQLNTGGTLIQALTTPAAAGTYDAANQMSAFGSQSLTYDANGNRLSESGSGGTTSYTWDGRNRLQTIVQPGGVNTQFTYDFNGNLIQQTASGMVTTYLLDRMTNIVAISTGGSAPLSLLTGASVDSHYATVSVGGQAEFSLLDGIHTVVASSGASAALDGTNLFEPFGQTTASGASFPFAFAGRPLFAGGSVYYFRSRYYDPAAGRFLSEDSSPWFDINRYLYLGNNPRSTSNPFGMSAHGGGK